MKINNINLYAPVNFFGLNKKTSPSFHGLKEDVFEIRTEKAPSETNSRIKENSRQRVPFGVYKNILDKDSYIDENFDKVLNHIKVAAKRSVFAAEKTKEMFDKTYGENNYVVVSIGTSPSGIAKAMEFQGTDVRYVPISSLDSLYSSELNYQDMPKKLDNKGRYKDFLNSIGLNKENVENDKRHYVVIDYTSSGSSLGIVQSVAENVFDIKSDNVHYLSLNKSLKKYAEKNCNQEEQKAIKQYINLYFEYHLMETMCGIPHLHYNNLDSIDYLMSENKDKAALGFEIALCHYIKEGQKNEN